MRLLRLIQRRHLAYELLREYDDEQRPIDPERWKRGMEVLSKYGATHYVTPGAAERWRAAVEQQAARYPSG